MKWIPMNSGFSMWCSENAEFRALKMGFSAQVSLGGRGCGTSVSQSSSPWCAGSALSRRCSAVVPVRGRPHTKIGRSIGTSAYDGCSWKPCSDSSRPTSALLMNVRCM